MSGPIRVVVVDDSPVCRELLHELLEADGDIRVIAQAADGKTGLERIAEMRPDLVAVDLRMPGMDGLELVERIMNEAPAPVLVITGDPAGASREGVFEAVRRGALDVARKPAVDDGPAAHALRRRVRELSRVPVVRHLRPRARTTVPPPAARPVDPERRRVSVVGMVSSAGGPAALVSVLRSLPPNLPVPVALVQHLPAGFAPSFAEFLRSRTALRARVVEGATHGAPGEILLCDAGGHLVVRADGRFDVQSGDPVEGHRPSGTVLFRSLAEHLAHRAMGIVLSGMGRDGVDGLAILRSRGAPTLAQDRASAAVYGMPRAAADEGAAERILSPSEIGAAIAEAVGLGAAIGAVRDAP